VKANKQLRQFSKQHDFRLVTFAFESRQKTVCELEACVRVQDADRLGEIFRELNEMAQAAEDEAKTLEF
jgi:hypothetical protein